MTDVVELHDCVRKKTKNLGKLLKSGAIPDAEIEVCVCSQGIGVLSHVISCTLWRM